MTSAWCDVLDSLAAQVDRQERCIVLGHDAPDDLEIDPPDHPMSEMERVRAIELFERCEALAMTATTGLVSLARRRLAASPYGSATERDLSTHSHRS